MKIAVAGLGYVGLSLSALLAQYNDVVSVDAVKEKGRKKRMNGNLRFGIGRLRSTFAKMIKD